MKNQNLKWIMDKLNEFLNLKKQRKNSQINEGRIIKYYRGKALIFRKSDVINFLEDRVEQNK